jgi:hypothetical protein
MTGTPYANRRRDDDFGPARIYLLEVGAMATHAAVCGDLREVVTALQVLARQHPVALALMPASEERAA